METYFKYKLLFEYYIPIGVLIAIGLFLIGLFVAAKISDLLDKEDSENGKDY